MKRILFTALVLIGMINVQAQNTETTKSGYNNQLLIAPIHFAASTFMLSYERMMPSNKSALRITPSVTFSNTERNTWRDDYQIGREGFGLDLGYKFYMFNNPRKVNIYFGPYAMGKYIKRNYSESPSKETTVIGVGVDAGLKMVFGRFVMDFTAGGGLRTSIFEGSDEHAVDNIFDDRYRGIMPRANFMIGMAF